MKAIFFTVLLFVTLICAWDRRLSHDCVYGIQDPSSCCKDVPDAWFAHLKNPEDCASYYQCAGGAPVLMPCPEVLHWSVEMDSCQYQSVANCSVNVAP